MPLIAVHEPKCVPYKHSVHLANDPFLMHFSLFDACDRSLSHYINISYDLSFTVSAL